MEVHVQVQAAAEPLDDRHRAAPALLDPVLARPECISDRAYRSREHLADDIVRVLREEVHALLAAGAALVQLDEPVLSEEVLRSLRRDLRVGVGVVNQKHERVETGEEILARGRRAVDVLGAERVLLTPDCGFATFADSLVASARVAEAKLQAMARAAAVLRHG